MVTEADPLDAFMSKVSVESLDYQTRHSLFSELRDTLESYHGSNEYSKFLSKTIVIFFKELDTVPISFVSNSPEQKLRYLILEILHMLPLNETLEPYAEKLLLKLSKIIREDNEENGILCLKLITSLHKAYKAKVESHVPDFVDFLEAVYKEMPKVVEEQFGPLKEKKDQPETEKKTEETTSKDINEISKSEDSSERSQEKLAIKEEEHSETKTKADVHASEQQTDKTDNKAKEQQTEGSEDAEKAEAKMEITNNTDSIIKEDVIESKDANETEEEQKATTEDTCLESKKEEDDDITMTDTVEKENNVEHEPESQKEETSATHTSNPKGLSTGSIPATGKTASMASSYSSSEDSSNILFPAVKSFKMAAECPITLVSLYSSYKSTIESNIPEFVPLVIGMLRLQAAKQKQAHEEAAKNGTYLTHVSYDIKNRTIYSDFVLAQVKAASFLAYVFIRRSAVETMQPFQNEIPDLIIRLLQDCPSEMSTARRELLHATRHILSTDYRKLFLPKIDMLFDDRVLIGDGLTAYETLRPLAYSIVADFIHVNSDLSPKQIWKSVVKYCGYLQDTTLAPTVHIMSAKLLLNLLGRILKLESKGDARQLFLIMVDSFSKRFASLNRDYSNVLKEHKKYFEKKANKVIHMKSMQSEAAEVTSHESNLSKRKADEVEVNENVIKKKAKTDTDENKTKEHEPENKTTVGNKMLDEPSTEEKSKDNIEIALPIVVSTPNIQDPLDGARYLFRTLMTFLKSICYGFKSCNPAPPKGYEAQQWKEWARLTSNEELEIFKRLFRECILGLRFFQSSKKIVITKAMRQSFDITGPNLPITSSKEEKDLMEILATIFIYLEPSSFNEIVRCEMERTFEATLKNPALLHIPQFFLANEITTSNYSGVLIAFSISKLQELGETDIVKSNILIRLFKLCFMSVNLFPAVNEAVILPHLNNLILKCLHFSTTAKEPIVYFYLIRTLFRSIGGGRFEALYKEILPLLHVLLESLNRLIDCARRPSERDIYVELCLTVPVRLSVLVPYLGYLMRPLVFALNGPPDLVSQGLRTLELCVDNLTAEYFDPIIESVVEDVAKALWKHLKPLPYYHQHSHTTLRILGKLGGRNRAFMKIFNDLKGETVSNQELEAMVKLKGLKGESSMPIAAALPTAFKTLRSVRYKLHYRESAFKYLLSLLKLMIGSPDTEIISSGVYVKYVQQITNFVNSDAKEPVDQTKVHLKADKPHDKAKQEKQDKLFVELIEAIFYGASIESCKKEATDFIEGLCRHTVLLYLGRSMVEFHKYNRTFSAENHEGIRYLNENSMFDGISYALSFYNEEVRKLGERAIHIIYNTCAELAGSKRDAIKFLPIRRMCSSFIHNCYAEKYFDKLGGCKGLEVMICGSTDSDDKNAKGLGIPCAYFALRQLEITRAMFFVLRDTPAELPSAVCGVARNVLLTLFRQCNGNGAVSKDDVFKQPFQAVVSQIVFDLSNSSPVVRKTAQQALGVLSEVTGVPIATMISPSKGILLAPIFGKPLRALPFHMQIGNIDAISFCLGLEDTFLEFNDELNRLLSEALALVDAEDESLISAHRVTEHRTAEQLVTLRVVCIRLLSLALARPEFLTGNPQARIHILSVFFKALCSKSTKVIDAAHAGLKSVLSRNSKLPKELLQSGLRPMLMNLSDHKKLTVEGLEALARLLELLNTYFKVEIGRKLLDHLVAWAQPQTLRRIAATSDPDGHEIIRIIVAILKIFHLLPPQAFQFMNEILNTLIYLESTLRRYGNSPFREPLALYVERFAKQAIDFFQTRQASRAFGSRYAYFVSLKKCRMLRKLTEERLALFVKLIKDEKNGELKCARFANLVDLVEGIQKGEQISDNAQVNSTAASTEVTDLKSSSVLEENAVANSDAAKSIMSNPSLFNSLLMLLSECRVYVKTAGLSSQVHLQIDQAELKLQDVYIQFLKSIHASKEHPEFIVRFVNYLSRSKARMSFNLKNFLTADFTGTNIESKEDLTKLLCFITTCLSSDKYVLDTKLYLVKNMLIPAVCASNAKDMLDSGSLISCLYENVWKNGVTIASAHESCVVDKYRVELLQLTTVILIHFTSSVGSQRKAIIKFFWSFMGLEDAIAKQAAYTATTYFISIFDTPAKVVTQVFVALLKANQVDVRYMVKQALDNLAPVLSKRIGSTSGWMKWPRRVLSEDGFNVTQVLNVHRFIVSHGDLFYRTRDQFVPNIITAMGKLTVLNNSSAENQELAIDMAELILHWEEKSKSEQQGDAFYRVPLFQRETCITFLIRYVCICQQRASENILGQRALNVLHVLLSPDYWPEVTVKLTFFERFLITADFSASNVLGYCLNALEVLYAALEWKTSLWIMSNLAYLQKLLEKCIKSDNHDVQESLQKVIALIFKAIREEEQKAKKNEDATLEKNPADGGANILAVKLDETPREEESSDMSSPLKDENADEEVSTAAEVNINTAPDATAFIGFVIKVIGDDLNSINSFAAGITLAWTASTYDPAALDPLMAPLMRALSKLVKDHLTLGTGAGIATIQGATNPVKSEVGANKISATTAASQAEDISASGNTQQTHDKSTNANEHRISGSPLGGPAGLIVTGSRASSYEAKMTTSLVQKAVTLAAMRVSTLGDQRRIFLSLLVQLIERSQAGDVLRLIMNIVRDWIFGSKNDSDTTDGDDKKDTKLSNSEKAKIDKAQNVNSKTNGKNAHLDSKLSGYPTVKEKTGLLIKMMAFEQKGDNELVASYYRMIADIFEDPKLAYGELTYRLERPFLCGTKTSSVPVRRKLMKILDKSLDTDAISRLLYVIRDQDWECLADYPWLNQGCQILMGAVDMEKPLALSAQENKEAPLSAIKEGWPGEKLHETAVSDTVAKLVEQEKQFSSEHLKLTTGQVFSSAEDLMYQSPETIQRAWCTSFRIICRQMNNRQRGELTRSLVALLSKEYHSRQREARPNVVATILAACGGCDPSLQLPAHFVKYLAQNYCAWYSGIRLLEQAAEHPTTDNPTISASNSDALLELYSSLREDDIFYGLWRRRAKYRETNAALSYEQLGDWPRAQKLYELAQVRARSGALPFSQSEYSLWEDGWVLCAQKLQQWDVLTELAKHEGFTDLLLECGWRVADWMADREPLAASVRAVMDIPTPRRAMFRAFLCLQGYAEGRESVQEVTRSCDEGIQEALARWHSLPVRVTKGHVALLHQFQQYVEFVEASQVYRSLAATTAENLDVKSQELKRVLQAWRERLPNIWDDISVWDDVATWRQHAFSVINKVYMPLVQSASPPVHSYAFRGYHEIAWIVNRFAHVSRKHHMPEVCLRQLTKIYTLPNIEIQEAFLKLREQARCHYENPKELRTGLDVISNTNLVYFAAQQKAEFITLKGMFLAKLEAPDDANQAFATAVQLDLNLPKAWAQWGFFNDERQQTTHNIAYARHAISCYLQAAGLYKNNKARRLLCRILVLLATDDAQGTLVSTFESHQGEMPIWQWVTFVPQLLTSLSHREARAGRHVLVRIAKSYPQALHFQLRTTKEDYALLGQMRGANSNNNSGSGSNSDNSRSATADKKNEQTDKSAKKEDNASDAKIEEKTLTEKTESSDKTTTDKTSNDLSSKVTVTAEKTDATTTKPDNTNSTSQQSNESTAKVSPWAMIDEIMAILKTAYPLLALSLESLVDQISQRFKSTHDGDAYRLVVALYNDAVQYYNRLPNPTKDARLPAATEANILRFADTVLPKHIRKAFEEDIILSKPNLETYISKLNRWKKALEEKLDRTCGPVNLERVCPHLSQFHHQKFEEIEVPGQYLLNKDNNAHFVKIERFMPVLDLVRGPTACYKRLTIRGQDGSLHPFAVQFPAARHCRREERISQMFRLLNDELSRTVETRRRSIDFTLPLAVPLSPHIRLISDDPSYVDMSYIYEDYCRRKGQNTEEPLAYTMEKMHASYDPKLPRPDILSVKTEILAAIQALLVPNSVMKLYFLRHYPKFEDFWMFRKQFSSQYAAFIFVTYMLCINSRQPYKIHINQNSGRVWTSEMLPYKVACGRTHTNVFSGSKTLDLAQQRAAPIFCSLELVPFRLTPNVQKLIGEVRMEGILSMHLMVIAQCLSNPAYKIGHFLDLFIRDEVIAWYTQRRKRSSLPDEQLQEIVRVNVDYIIRRISQMARVDGTGHGIASQYILNLIGHAVNPRNLASTDTLWMAYF